MINVKIYNIDDEEVSEDSLDMTLGRLVPDARVSRHIPASPYVPAVTHDRLSVVYFANGEKYVITGDDDPHLGEDGQTFVRLPGEYESTGTDYDPYYIFGQDFVTIVDVPAVPQEFEHDEYENIYRYIMYTDEELAAIDAANTREEFLGGAPARLTEVELSAEEAQAAIAELGAIADETATNAEDLLNASAELGAIVEGNATSVDELMDASAELGTLVEDNTLSIEDLMNAIAELGAIVAGE